MGVICACLPTLGPVFQRRTLQDFLHSLDNFFSIRSRRSEDRDLSLPINVNRNPVASRHGDSNGRPFYPMDDEQFLVTDVLPLPHNEREAAGYPLSSIIVNSSIQSSVEQRKQKRM